MAPCAICFVRCYAHLTAGVEAGLTAANFGDYLDDEDPPVGRFRAEYRRG